MESGKRSLLVRLSVLERELKELIIECHRLQAKSDHYKEALEDVMHGGPRMGAVFCVETAKEALSGEE